MTETRLDRMVYELSKLDKDEFSAFLKEVEQKREERHREKLRDAFNAFNESWERMEELGYYPVLPLANGEETISLDIIIWREDKRKEN